MSATEPLLKIENLTKSFMGLKAVDDLSFSVPHHKVIGLIGPNGAGKSTAFNLISKLYEPNQGHIFLEGKEISALKPHEVNKAGIARTFQNIRLLNQLTVMENVLVALGTRSKYSMVNVILNGRAQRREEERLQEVATNLLQKAADLYERRHDKAYSLSYGQQRQLEIIRALATQPKLLLMDEPAAGMDGTEKQQLKEFIKFLLSEGLSVLLIEHDMSFVMDICAYIIVLNFGRKIAEGSSEQIQSNKKVVEAYLGRKRDANS